MKVFKYLILFIVLSFVFNLFFINQSKAEESSVESQLIENTGSNCGYPNTESNQCCVVNNSSGKIEESALSSTINNFKNCTLTENQIENGDALSTCINDQEANILMTLINTEKKDNIKALVLEGVKAYILSSDENKKTSFTTQVPFLGTITISEIESFFRGKRVIYNNLSYGEKTKIQIANSIPKDHCLINLLGGSTLCFRGMAQFFAGSVGDNTSIKAVLEANSKIVADQCVIGKPDTSSGSCICVADTSLSSLCNYITNDQEFNQCIDCSKNKFGFWTGFGCINLTFSGFVQNTLFGWAIGLAGIITLFCIIYAAFMLQTSAGNPERIKKARQYLTACITGLILIIFSILILRIIGVDILKIPGFN